MDRNTKEVVIDKPLMDDNLRENEEAKAVIESLQDEDIFYNLTILVHSKEMVPTAMAMSMSKRHNVEYHAKISRFYGVEYVFGFLKSSYFKTLEWVDDKS